MEAHSAVVKSFQKKTEGFFRFSISESDSVTQNHNAAKWPIFAIFAIFLNYEFAFFHKIKKIHHYGRNTADVTLWYSNGTGFRWETMAKHDVTLWTCNTMGVTGP